MRKNTSEHKIGGIFTLLVFCIFIFSVLFVLLFGARIYSNVSARNEGALASRTCTQYIATKIRQMDAAGAVRIEPFSPQEEISTLVLYQEIDGILYCTKIYYYDGFVYEIFAEAGDTFAPDAGSRVLAMSGLEFFSDGDMIIISSTNMAGETTTLPISLRSGEPGGAK